jgi:hypothetical protein
MATWYGAVLFLFVGKIVVYLMRLRFSGCLTPGCHHGTADLTLVGCILWLQDVGQNNIELWNFKTGGGWIHPIHVHLVVRAPRMDAAACPAESPLLRVWPYDDPSVEMAIALCGLSACEMYLDCSSAAAHTEYPTAFICFPALPFAYLVATCVCTCCTSKLTARALLFAGLLLPGHQGQRLAAVPAGVRQCPQGRAWAASIMMCSR